MSKAAGIDTETATVSLQKRFAAHLRSPSSVGLPVDLEERRVKIYRDLVFNNISNFLAGSFPVINKLLSDEQWQELIRDFIAGHKAQSPRFTQLAAEFVSFLTDRDVGAKPAFIAELASYEALEIELYLSDKVPPSDQLSELYESEAALLVSQQRVQESDSEFIQQLLGESPLLSSLVEIRQYHYEVHRISSDYIPTEPLEAPVTIIVYRNQQDKVRFVETNPLTATLLLYCDGSRSLLAIFDQLMSEVAGLSLDQLTGFALPLLLQFGHDNILAFGVE